MGLDIMTERSILNLPNEIIEKHLLSYVSSKDIESFGNTGLKRFKEIAIQVIEERSAYYRD